jgi:hypothetical protein
VTGDACLAPLFQSFVGVTEQQTISITQTGSTLRARSTSQQSGAACDWEGQAGQSTITLNWTFCDAAIIRGIQCAPGQWRDMSLQTSGVTATVNGNRANGTMADSYNVTVSGSGSSAGVLISNASFTMTKQ